MDSKARMMRWYASVEMTGALTDAQIEAVGDNDRPASMIADGDRKTLEIRLHVDADDYHAAVMEALATFDGMDTVQDLIGVGILSSPRRFVVQDERTEAQSLGILSTAGVAERLGVSSARVRQLKEVEPDFPPALSIPGAAGDFYRTVDVDLYAASRKPGSSQQGKPRAGDEQLLNDGLRGILNAPLQLDLTEVGIIERALHGKGGRYVRGKAKVLVETADRYGHRATPVSGSDRFLEALQRAREIRRP